jgi:putative endonuclease
MTTATSTIKSRKALQTKAEDIACQHLESCDAKIMERNWKCQSGSADIIALDDEDLVFIEVKARLAGASGFPEEGVTRERRRYYEKIAMEYLFSHNLPNARVRFDVMALLLDTSNRAFLRHHKDALCTD